MHLLAIGGSDAGIAAALRARELDPSSDVTVVVADAFPNFSICGIPYYVSGEVPRWQNLAHRTVAELEATGMRLRLDTWAKEVETKGHKVLLTRPDGHDELVSYDALIVGTGALPVHPPIDGLRGPSALGPEDGVHLLHSMGDTFELMRTLEAGPRSAVIVGAGYIGLEMAEGLIGRGMQVTQIEQLPEVLPTVDPELGALIRTELERHGVEVLCGTAVRSIERDRRGAGGLRVNAEGVSGPVSEVADVVLVVVGVRPDTALAATAGVELGPKGAIVVDRRMQTNVADIFAAGDCVTTYHRLLGDTYLPLGTTAHKQGRVAAENALGGARDFEGSLGTQVVKVFDAVAARTGLRDHESVAAGFQPLTIGSEADDHKAYYPGAHKIAMRYSGDRDSGRLLGLQLVGRLGTEVSKRIDVAATAIFNSMAVDALNDLDLSYSPPLGSPWDALQLGAQAWVREWKLQAVGRVTG